MPKHQSVNQAARAREAAFPILRPHFATHQFHCRTFRLCAIAVVNSHRVVTAVRTRQCEDHAITADTKVVLADLAACAGVIGGSVVPRLSIRRKSLPLPQYHVGREATAQEPTVGNAA